MGWDDGILSRGPMPSGIPSWGPIDNGAPSRDGVRAHFCPSPLVSWSGNTRNGDEAKRSMTEAFERAIQTRIRAIAGTPEATRQALAQHLTPPEVASLAVSLFSDADHRLKCLDLGGGTGILSVALLERYGERIGQLDTIELDPTLARIYDDEVRDRVPGITTIGDALAKGVGDGPLYDRIILNPPTRRWHRTTRGRRRFRPTRQTSIRHS